MIKHLVWGTVALFTISTIGLYFGVSNPFIYKGSHGEEVKIGGKIPTTEKIPKSNTLNPKDILKHSSMDKFNSYNIDIEKLIKEYKSNPQWWKNNPVKIFKLIDEDKENQQITVLIKFKDEKKNVINIYQMNKSSTSIEKKLQRKHIVNNSNWKTTWEKNLISYVEERNIVTPNGQLQIDEPILSGKESVKDIYNIENTYGYIYTNKGQFYITHYSYYTTWKKNNKTPKWIYKKSKGQIKE